MTPDLAALRELVESQAAEIERYQALVAELQYSVKVAPGWNKNHSDLLTRHGFAATSEAAE